MQFNSKLTSDLDQAITIATTHFPPLWHGLYVNLMAEGFTEAQAMELVKTYILTMKVG